MKIEKFNYAPIAAQPAYKDAAEKLSAFTVQLDVVQKTLEAVLAEFAARWNRSKPQTHESAIEDAENLMLGRNVPDTFAERIAAAQRAVGVLTQAVVAQRAALTDVSRTLCQKAGSDLSALHIGIVTRLADAINELHAANMAEINFRDELTRLGYIAAQALPAMQYAGAQDPGDSNGTHAFYWMQSSRGYIGR